VSRAFAWSLQPFFFPVLLGVALLSGVGAGAQTVGSVTLAWDANPEAGISGYRLYQGTRSGVYTKTNDLGKATTATVPGLTSGVTYYFVLTAYDTIGLESPFSNEITYTPASSVPPAITFSALANSTSFTAPATINLSAAVNPNGHSISKVQFFNGSTLLDEETVPPYTYTWSDVAAGSYVLSVKAFYDAGTTVFSGSINLVVAPAPQPPRPTPLVFAADSGSLTAPFITSDGTVFQPVETGLADGGRAVYSFTVPVAGQYVVSALVRAPNQGANSFFVNIDAEPTDPMMVWDIPVADSFTNQIVSWRSNGTSDYSQFVPKIFSLGAGTHELIIRGREAYTVLSAITISPYGVAPSLPPAIVLAASGDGTSYTAPATINLAVAVTPKGHTISKVQFYDGSILLGEDTTSPYTITWSNVAAGTYVLSAKALYDGGATVSSESINLVVAAAPKPPPPSPLVFTTDSGSIAAPFTTSDGTVFQPVETGLADGGRAVYSFTVPAAGQFVVSALVSAPNQVANSFFVNIDAEPTDPMMIWDIPIADGFTNQTVSWRGNGTPEADQFTPRVFSLSAGTHQLIIRGREAYTMLGAITISPYDGAPNPHPSIVSSAPATGSLPAPWQAADIGTMEAPGSASVTNGTYTVSGAGNLDGSADSFSFLYQPLTGDGEIRTQISSMQNTSAGALAGVIMREALTPGSQYAFIGSSPSGIVRAQWRSGTSSPSDSTTAGTGAFPNIWVRLVRSGDTFYGYVSADGAYWSLVESSSIPMANTVYFGFAVASGSSSAINASTFNHATVIP